MLTRRSQSDGYLLTDGHVSTGYFYAASVPIDTASAALSIQPNSITVQLYWQPV